MKVVLYAIKPTGRTKNVALAMGEGLRKHGIKFDMLRRHNGVKGDVAIAYGWNHERIFKKYTNYVYLDMGYWNRGRHGAHRVSINDWCTSVNMLHGLSCDRWKASRINLKKLNPSANDILITSMSDKSLLTHSLKKGTIEANFRKYLNDLNIQGNIVERVKPRGHLKIQSIQDALSTAKLLLTHHSNTAVDALIAGVPYFCFKGAARKLSLKNISDLKYPVLPSDKDRLQLLSDIAYSQYTIDEMRNGIAWDYIRQVLKSK